MFIPKSIICLRKYSWNQFRSDLGAGIVVGLVALPLAMAFAIASGVGPEQGLYTAVIAGFIISALSGSRVQIGGPTGAFVVIVAGIMAKYGYNGLVVATLIAGIILLVMGFSRLGTMVKFIPYPVTTGFTAGIAVIIFSSQMKDFFGLQMDHVPAEFVKKWSAYLHALPTVNWWAVSIAVFTILCISLWPKSWQKVPGSIAALLTASIAAAVFNLPVETIQSRFGGIPHGLPRPAFPSLSWNTIQQMFPSAITVAFLAAVESLLSAVVADGMIGGRHKSNMELVAQGVANLASPIFGGIPATGAIARTATNVKNGGRTPVAGMIHALVLLIILLAAGKLAAKIPLACLAGVLVVVSYHMSEWRSFQSMLSSPKSDIAVLLITFLLTVFIDLTVAVEVGMVLAAFLFMKQITNLTKIQIVTKELEETESEVSETYRNLPIPDGVEVYAVHGSFSFGAANKLLEVDRITEKAPQVLVLDMASVLYMDATGLHVLEQMHKNCVKAGIRLVIAGIHAQPLTVMEQADKLEAFGAKNFKGSVAQIFSEIHHSDSAKLS